MAEYIKTLINLYVPRLEETDQHEGQGMVEYALILALISIVVIAVLVLFNEPLTNIYNEILDALQVGDGGS
jgi:pilus assembly protein Flp/PilA